MTEFSEEFDAPIAYPPESLSEVLADVLAAAGSAQLHVAETEKYPHVTYFFDGGNEHRRDGEEWRLVRFSRDVATYDLAPEMSAEAITDVLCDRLAQGGLGFLLINFANPDMVGHTGVIPAAVRAVEVADACLGRVLAAVTAAGGMVLVTADHGNAEEMLDRRRLAAHGPHHQSGAAGDHPHGRSRLRDGGRLADVAPTVLGLLGTRRAGIDVRAEPGCIGETRFAQMSKVSLDSARMGVSIPGWPVSILRPVPVTTPTQFGSPTA